MSKTTIDVESLGVHQNSLKSMINILANMIGDEVYIHHVLEIESSDQVINSLKAIIEGVKHKSNKSKEVPVKE